MKIYIVGSVSSGKSTLAKKLSEELNIPYTSLDNVVYEIDLSNPRSNTKRTDLERDKLFNFITDENNWIIEDVGRSCFKDGLKKADKIILLDTNKYIRNYRIVKRFMKQKLGIEKCSYTPNFKMLSLMLQWSKNYDSGKDKLKSKISIYEEKVIVLRNTNDIKNLIFKNLNSLNKNGNYIL